MKDRAIIIDLDGTMSDSSHRKHFVERPKGEKKDFNSFHEGLIDDPPNKWCIEIVMNFISEVKILFITGRPEEYRELTKKWIANNSYLHPAQYKLFMRETGNYEQDYQLKERLYKDSVQKRYDILFCIDDRKQVVDMWRRIGLTCLQCAEGNF